MLDWLFTTYRSDIALGVAIPFTLFGGLALLVVSPLLEAIAEERVRRWISGLALVPIAIAAAHLALLLFGRAAAESGEQARQLVSLFLIALATGGVTWGAHSLISPGGRLRESARLARNPARQRGEMGSATFCLPADFARLQQPKPGALELKGAFYGKNSRNEPSARFKRLDQGLFTAAYPGRGISLSEEDQARGMAVLGAPGSGKTQAVILPAIADSMALGQSLIVVDPQGELTDYILDFATVTRYNILIHDPTSTQHLRYNLTSGITDVAEAQAITHVLIPDRSGSGDDGFWQKSAQNLLAACLLRFDSLGEILLVLADIPGLAERLQETEDGAGYLASSFIASAKTDGKLAAGIVATLQASALSAWADETVREATQDTEFSAKMLVDEPTVLVLRCPARYIKVYGPYLGAVLRRLMLDLDTLGQSTPGGALARPVKIVLDEFPMLGRLDAMVEAVNIFRKRRIGFLLAAQTLSQFELNYGRAGAESLIAGLATQIVFGGCDPATAQHVSRALGRTTIRRDDPAQPSGHGRDLVTLDEVVTPAVGSCTIIYRYATATYATQLAMLAELTPIYLRADWQQAIAQARVQGAFPLVLSRPRFADQRSPARTSRRSGRLAEETEQV